VSVSILRTGDLVRAVGDVSRYEDIVSEVERFKRVDLLLVDDFQYAETDEMTQDQIFHILNEIFRGSGSAVVATRISPHSLRGIHDHLGSRIRSGVEFSIKPASLDLQTRLLRRFAQDVNLVLPDSVVEFILARYDRNPVELKRIVQRVGHYALTSKRKVSIPVVKSALEE
jgi:chromosomal replication initiator protein